MRPRLLDLFCGAGGAAMGYHRAGFDVVGVDIKPQPNYPFEFVQDDALALMSTWTESVNGWWDEPPFDAIHASPPCQYYMQLAYSQRHWRSVPPTREAILRTGLPYVIENVPTAKPDLVGPMLLCGSMFGLNVRRHRLFEHSMPLIMQPSCSHGQQTELRGYYGSGGKQLQKYGRAQTIFRGNVKQGVEDMGIDWMTWDELRESIPPAYTEFIGHQLIAHIKATT